MLPRVRIRLTRVHYQRCDVSEKLGLTKEDTTDKRLDFLPIRTGKGNSKKRDHHLCLFC